MKKAIGTALGVFVVLAIALAIIPTTRDEIHWRWASHKDDTASYEAYVKDWPAGRHAAEARLRYDNQSWADATAANTVQGFERYAQLHGDGKHIAEAKDNIESLHWQEATTANTVQGFERYVQLHGDGKHIAEAKDNIESLHWQEANSGNTFRTLQVYLDRYPAGQHVREARSKQTTLLSDDAVFMRARQKGTVEALREFVTEFPGHDREAEATQALKEAGKAVVVADYPKEIRANGRYSWTTVFREASGHSGFTLREMNFYMVDPQGATWSSSRTGYTVKVAAGGTGRSSHWVDRDERWNGSTYYRTWVGQDDYGNSIRINEQVKLLK